MAWPKQKSRYESEVHLSFLAIASLLVFLNFVSNFVIFNVRSTLQEETLEQLRQAAVSASREVQAKYPTSLSLSELDHVREHNELDGLSLVPLKPVDNSYEARRSWFRAVMLKFPPSDHPELADKLYRAKIHELTRGEGDEYYYLYPIPAGAGGSLLVLTLERSNLAYLDDSRNLLMVVFIGSLLVVGLIYILLAKFIFKPFRRLKETAEQAGRQMTNDSDETEAVIEEYERVIRQLTKTRAELISLNEEVSRRADSLELFNRYLMDSSRSGVVTLDHDGEVAAVNDIAISMLGFDDADKFVGFPYDQLFADCDPLIRDIEQALHEDEAWGYHEYADSTSDRGEISFGVTLIDIRNSDRKTTGLLLMINDLTEISCLRHELEGRKRLAALGEMAGGLAHQIRNSLGAISGYGTLLKKRLKRDGLSSDSAEQLLEETHEAGELITRFLSFARPFEYSAELVDLGRLVGESLESFGVRDDYEQVTLRTVLPNGVKVQADPILFKQAIGNLVNNAIDSYGAEGGEVEVRVETEANRALIIISDQGCGIPVDKVDQIFTPFFSSRPSGTGLGLSLVAKILDLHSGHVSVQSVVGQGSRFTLSLPLDITHTPEGVAQEISSTH
ncbi:MAG: PAS domain-containing protein [candidate division Zixibacteria bacterium]|nr:PAS domain-containing protein [candidate division Zixibacteria bacterium]